MSDEPTNDRVDHVRKGGALCATCFEPLRSMGGGRFEHVNKLKRHAAEPAGVSEARAYAFRRTRDALAAIAVIATKDKKETTDEDLLNLLTEEYHSTGVKVDEARRLLAAMERGGDDS